MRSQGDDPAALPTAPPQVFGAERGMTPEWQRMPAAPATMVQLLLCAS